MSQSPLPDDFSDHRFAVKHVVSLYLRVYPAPPSSPIPTGSSKRPWVLWIRGGAYCSGQHYQIRNWILPLFHARGYHVVSTAHRFMPFVEMEDMVLDCLDAYTWTRENLPKLLDDRGGLDLARSVIGGDSAGGGLATLLIHRLPLDQRPKAVINVYGVTDLVRQQQWHEAQPPPDQPWTWGAVSEADLMPFYNDTDPSHALTATTNMWNLEYLSPEVRNGGPKAIAKGLKELWKVSDEEWVHDERVERQWDIKGYVGYRNAMVSLALRLNEGMTQKEKEEKLKRYSSVWLLDGEKSYPPTVLLHGTGDAAVPVDESRDMAEKLKKMRVDTLELYKDGEPHGFDNIYTVSRSGLPSRCLA